MTGTGYNIRAGSLELARRFGTLDSDRSLCFNPGVVSPSTPAKEALVATKFEVRRQLAGFSGSSRWVQSYTSLSAAKKRADLETGCGAIGVVAKQVTGEIVYRGSAS